MRTSEELHSNIAGMCSIVEPHLKGFQRCKTFLSCTCTLYILYLVIGVTHNYQCIIIIIHRRFY